MVTIVGQDAAGNHQRVPISPIAPKGEVPKPWEGPYFPYFPYFPARWSQDAAGNHQRVPITPIAPKGEVPKPWEGPYFPYFPYFGGPCLFILPRHGPPK